MAGDRRLGRSRSGPGAARGRAAASVGAALAVLAAGLVTAYPSPADAAPRLTVSKTRNLKPAGETVTVSGRGYDVKKGVYVALCVDNGPRKAPSPCIGGVDMSGKSGSSVWVSSNPPAYGKGIAKPYSKGGTFRVRLRLKAVDGSIDCRKRTCAVVTRADHTRSADRSQDVRVRVAFAKK
ncbi:hypothetical protein [Motilibacter deserti]|uniref:Neocarzinostatin family protein n=1 Tax=Motilibacter deserti TaxID=2714956 RepID=A0ABX0GRK7_9ACTN|nr:hypothetical protein [Motilibacter deserti]NHC12741.1 hypothetical protein [Motilibacter deserti]